MPQRVTKSVPNKFPLRLLPSVRRAAEEFAAKDGVSLNQFINVAIAERLGQLRHRAWVEGRARVTDASIAEAFAILDRGGRQPVEPGDELPKGYAPIRKSRTVFSALRGSANAYKSTDNVTALMRGEGRRRKRA